MRKKRIAALAAAILLAAAALICQLTDHTAPVPEVVVLDVGEGSATLIRTDAGNILIDAGPESSQEILCEKLRRMGVRRFELVAFTHPDEDHIGGGDAILRAFPVREIWTNGVPDANDSYDTLLRAAEAVPMRGVSAGETITVGSAVLTVLSPETRRAEDGNEGSLVLMLEISGTRILIEGDAGQSTEVKLLERLGADALRADYLIAGHHGSNSASGTEFLEAVSPREIIISCGAGNDYGHPDGRALARMRSVCDDIRRTDLDGDIRIRSWDSSSLAS